MDVRAQLDSIYRTEGRRVFATLVRLLGDFDLAEDALHDAFAAALQKWPESGTPENPFAWLVSAGKFRAIDAMRRRARFNSSLENIAEQIEVREPESVEDDQLRLIFTCCHPALSPEARIALTLREVCGLTTEEIARAFLTTPPTIAQRIVRAKAKIRDAVIPYVIPESHELPERLETVLSVIYLVFNEGYSASSGQTLLRHDLSEEAIRLGYLLMDLLPEPEIRGLVALMLLSDSRRRARTDTQGDLIVLEDQDRSLWDTEKIRKGQALVREALASGRAGVYTLQAAISAVHSEAATPSETDWAQIVVYYNLLLGLSPSPVVELNRAIAVAMAEGPRVGLNLIEPLIERGELHEYRWAHSARADLYRRLKQPDEARQSYLQALSLTDQEAEKRFLERRLAEL